LFKASIKKQSRKSIKLRKKRSFEDFCIFHFPQKEIQDTLYFVWNKHGYINLLISGVINALAMI